MVAHQSVKIRDIEARIRTLEEQVSDFYRKYPDPKAEIDAIDKEIDSIRNTIKSHEERLAENNKSNPLVADAVARRLPYCPVCGRPIEKPEEFWSRRAGELGKAIKELVKTIEELRKRETGLLNRKGIIEILEKYGKYVSEISPDAILLFYEKKFQGREISVENFVDFFYKDAEGGFPFVENGKSILRSIRKLVLEGKIGLKDASDRPYSLDEVRMLKEDVLKESIITPTSLKTEERAMEERIEVKERVEEVVQPLEKEEAIVAKEFVILKEKNVNFVKDIIEPYRHFQDFIKLKSIRMEIEFEGEDAKKKDFIEFLKRKGFKII